MHRELSSNNDYCSYAFITDTALIKIQGKSGLHQEDITLQCHNWLLQACEINLFCRCNF